MRGCYVTVSLSCLCKLLTRHHNTLCAAPVPIPLPAPSPSSCNRHGPARANYLKDWWRVVNWQQVSRNYAAAVAGKPELIGQA